MIESKLMFVQLRQHCTYIQVCVCLGVHFGQPAFNGQCLFQIFESGLQLADPSVVTGKVVVSHRLAQLIVLTQDLTLLQQVEG